MIMMMMMMMITAGLETMHYWPVFLVIRAGKTTASSAPGRMFLCQPIPSTNKSNSSAIVSRNWRKLLRTVSMTMTRIAEKEVEEKAINV